MSCHIKAKLEVKTDAVRQQVSRSMWNIVTVLVGKEVMRIGWWHDGGCSDWFSILVAHIFIRCSSLQCTNVLSLSHARSVIVSALIPVYTSGRPGKIKRVSFLPILSHSLGLCCSLNWMKDWSRWKIFWWEL